MLTSVYKVFMNKPAEVSTLPKKAHAAIASTAVITNGTQVVTSNVNIIGILSEHIEGWMRCHDEGWELIWYVREDQDQLWGYLKQQWH